MDELSDARMLPLEELELGIETLGVDGAVAIEASTELVWIPDVEEAEELEEPPPDEAEPFCAEAQKLHVRIAAIQTEEFLSNRIGTRRARPRVEPGGLYFTPHPTPERQPMEDGRK